MAEQSESLEVITQNSPLLSSTVVERDYTRGIENQLGEAGKQPEKPVEEYNVGEDTTKGFTFEKKEGEPGSEPGKQPEPGKEGEGKGGAEAGKESDKDVETPIEIETETEGFRIPAESAREFAKWMGQMLEIYGPQVMFEIVRIDMNNIRWHVSQGNLQPHMAEVYESVNARVKEALKYSPDEIKMFVSSAKAWLEYENIKGINPRTQFILACGTIGVSSYMRCRNLTKELNQLVVDGLKQSNPSLFKDYKDDQRSKENIDKETKKDAKE